MGGKKIWIIKYAKKFSKNIIKQMLSMFVNILIWDYNLICYFFFLIRFTENMPFAA